MSNRTGRLYWVTGLAGAGKSTIARALHALLRAEQDNLVLLDGDALREVFGETDTHDLEARKNLALRYSRLAHLLTQQGLDVVCATISMFPEVWAWNREHIPGFRLVYLRVDMDTLVARDQKQLYSRALTGEIQDVMGVDLPFEEPAEADLVIENDGSTAPDEIARHIYKTLHSR